MDLKKTLADHALYLRGDPKGVRANLTNADLTNADLPFANLTNADLTNADLPFAYLRGAYLTNANLTNANLTNANLTNADLTGANLTNAYLTGAKGLLTIASPPEEGTFIAWKKVKDGYVLKLEVSGMRTGSYVGRKCRASLVKPVAAFLKGKRVWRKVFQAKRDGSEYRIGVTRKEELDSDPRIECTKGLHFFMTRIEAEEY